MVGRVRDPQRAELTKPNSFRKKTTILWFSTNPTANRRPRRLIQLCLCHDYIFPDTLKIINMNQHTLVFFKNSLSSFQYSFEYRKWGIGQAWRIITGVSFILIRSSQRREIVCSFIRLHLDDRSNGINDSLSHHHRCHDAFSLSTSSGSPRFAAHGKETCVKWAFLTAGFAFLTRRRSFLFFPSSFPLYFLPACLMHNLQSFSRHRQLIESHIMYSFLRGKNKTKRRISLFC